MISRTLFFPRIHWAVLRSRHVMFDMILMGSLHSSEFQGLSFCKIPGLRSVGNSVGFINYR